MTKFEYQTYLIVSDIIFQDSFLSVIFKPDQFANSNDFTI